MRYLIPLFVILMIGGPVATGIFVGLHNTPVAVELHAMEGSEAFIKTNNIKFTRVSCAGTQTDGYTKCIIGTTADPILLKCPTGFYLLRVQKFTSCREEPYPRYPVVPRLTDTHNDS